MGYQSVAPILRSWERANKNAQWYHWKPHVRENRAAI